MADRIDSVQNTIIQKPAKDTAGTRAGTVSRARDDGATAGTAANRGTKDSVTLTEQGRRLEQLELELAALPAVDNARVESVKADIEAGNYQIDVENIADILLSTEDEFSG